MFYKATVFTIALVYSLWSFAQAPKDNASKSNIENHTENSPKWTLQIVENEAGAEHLQKPEEKIPSNVSVAGNDDLQGPFIINGEDLDFILNLLEQLFQKPIIRAQGLPEKSLFNFRSKRKMPRDDAIVALRSLLMLNGVAIVPIDDKFLKAVPSANVSTQIPEFLDCPARELSPSQDFYTKFFELNNISVEDISGKLKTSQSGNAAGSIEIFPKSNAFLITDTLLNIQRIEELVERLDTPSEELFFMQAKNAPADDIKARILAVKSDKLKNAKIETDARTNKLIILAPKSAKPLIEKLVEELDADADAVLKSEVVYIRHSESAKIAEILKQIASGQKSAKDKKAKAKTAAEPAQAQAPQNPQGAENTAEEISGGAEFSQYLQIVADERSNAVVIYGTPLDIKQAKDVIEKLDIVLLQVKIDVIITEVALSEGQVSGLSSFGISYGVDDAGFAGSTHTYSLSDASAPAFSITATEKSFAAIFDVARQNQNVKVLSSPTIVTTHNKDGEVNISQSVPVITSTASDLSSITTTRSSVSYQDIGIRLLVKPLVGKNGTIQLDIDQSVDSISGYTTIDNNQQPLISKRRAKSFVSVNSNEVVVMAGLQQVDTTEVDAGVWLLSDIPLLGELFKPKKNESKHRELIIFIRPALIESSPANRVVDNNFKSPLASPEIENFFEKGKFYPNGELEKKAEDFEQNRPHNRLLSIPESLMK
ncbi:MAG: hypothetical protein J6T16_04485 [Opitutales bacterium]|nr:hypothetical protein [Opitutales bacterium]